MAKRAAKAKRTCAEALERRVPSKGRSCPKRSEEVARTAKVRHAQRRDVWRSGSESIFADAAKTLDGEGTQSEAAPLSEICTECPTIIPLSCVECCNITNLPREYSLMLVVRG